MQTTIIDSGVQAFPRNEKLTGESWYAFIYGHKVEMIWPCNRLVDCPGCTLPPAPTTALVCFVCTGRAVVFFFKILRIEIFVVLKVHVDD